MYMHFQLSSEKNPQAIKDTIAMLQYYAVEYPQAGVEVVALSSQGSHVAIIARASLGPAQKALSGTSPNVEATYRLMANLALSMYKKRFMLCVSPIESEKLAWEKFNSKEKEKTNTNI